MLDIYNSFAACVHEVSRTAVQIAEYAGDHASAFTEKLLLDAAYVLTPLLVLGLMGRATGYETVAPKDTAAHGFSPLQHELFGTVFPFDQSNKILACSNPETGAMVTFLASPFGFGVVALMRDPDNPGKVIVLLAETPDPVLQVLGFPEGSYNEPYTHRPVYVLDVRDAVEHPGTYLDTILHDAFKGKMAIDIGATNLFSVGGGKNTALGSGKYFLELKSHQFPPLDLTRYNITINAAAPRNKALVEKRPHLKIRDVTLPFDTSPEHAERAMHTIFLLQYHKAKEELAGLRIRTIRGAFTDLRREIADTVRHGLSQIPKNEHKVTLALTLYRYSHAASLASLVLVRGGLLEAIAKACGIPPALPAPMGYLKKHVNTFPDFGEHVHALKTNSPVFRRLQPIDLTEIFPDSYPVVTYSPVLTYFTNFATKPAGCVKSMAPEGCSLRRPGGISVTYPPGKDKSGVYFFRYDPVYSVWPDPLWKNEKTPKELARLEAQDIPPYARELFGPDYTNIIVFTKDKLYVLTPEQHGVFLKSDRKIPVEYVKCISYEPAQYIKPAPVGNLRLAADLDRNPQ